MKLTKRILATLVAVVFVLTSFVTVPSFAAFTDLTESDNSYEAVNVLNKLGVINGYDDGSFKPLNNVTRAEFTAMLLRTRGMGNVGSTSLENPPFPDVVSSDVSWAIANIRTARELGIINGYDDGTFKPNNNVSYEEAVKMIVCALGYGEMGSEGAFWYSKYLMTAKSLGFLDGAGGAIATPATRATIANMLYNCLEVKLAENNAITDKTILENDLKLTKNVGYISSNPQISLSKPDANLRDDEVEITVGNVASTYKVDDASKYNDMLGAQIEFYYQNDFNSGLKHLILATVKNSVTVKVKADLIQSGSTSGISYLKSEDAQRETNASIALNSVVVYNGKRFGATEEPSDFKTYYNEVGLPLVGSLELLDRDGDNVFDVVFVNDYEPYFVSAVTSSDYKITDNALRNGQSGGTNQIVLNYKSNDISFYTPDGATTSFSAIKKGSVIFVAKDRHYVNNAKVIVCNNTVSGKITATGTSKGYTINGKDYKASNLAPWENSLPGASPTLTVAPQMGDTAKFYLDLSGRVIWYDKTETASNQQYGYITGAKYDSSNFEETAKVEIVTKSNVKGSIYTITTKSKLNVNGSPVAITSLQNFVEKLDKANDGADNGKFEQLVKFTTSKGTEIEEIITYEVQSQGKEIKTDKLYKYTGIDTTQALKYVKGSKELQLNENEKIYIGSVTFVINVSDPSDYKIMRLEDFKNNQNYEVGIYDVTTSDSAKAIIVYSGTTNIGQLTSSSPVVLVKEKEQIGQNAYTLLDVNDNKYVLDAEDSVTVTEAAKIEKGDLVRLRGTEGAYQLQPGDIVFSPSTTSTGYFAEEHSESGNLFYRGIWGSSYKTYDNDRLIVSKSVLDGWNGEGTKPTVTPSTFALQSSWFKSSTKFYEIDTTKNNEITLKEDGIENVLSSLMPYVDGDEVTSITRPTELFIHMNGSSSVNMVIIVKR